MFAMPRPPRTASDLVVVLAFCGFFFYFGLGAFGLTGADEPRYAQVAREMLARHDWVVPTLNGQPWLEKPVLYYWEAIVSYMIFGVHDWAARLPSAVQATLLVLGIYGFGRRIAKLRTAAKNVTGVLGLDAALIAASMAAIIGFVGASTDMPLAANFALALLCWLLWYAGDSAGRAWLLGFYFFQALATLAKGPVAPGLAAITIILFALLRREPRIILRTLWWPGVLLYFAVATPWYWLVQARTGTFLRVFFLEHNLERFGTNAFRHLQPFWYFVPVLLTALLPWTIYGILAAVAAIRGAFRAPDRQVTRSPDALPLFLVLWGIVPVVFFSFSQSKLPGYILPAIPAWPLLLASWLDGDFDVAGHTPSLPATTEPRVNSALLALHAILAALLLMAAIVAPYRMLGLALPRAGLILALICTAGAAVGIFWTVYANGLRLLRFATLVPVVIAMAWIVRVAAPALDAKLSARPVARQLAAIETQPQPLAVLGASRQIEYGLAFYRNQSVASYDRGERPAAEHIVIAHAGSETTLRSQAPGRRVVRLSEFRAQNLEFWYVGAPGSAMEHSNVHSH
jgi:4-amino-4-deoxy-L-arabinose transferase-like glycosyltransferase